MVLWLHAVLHHLDDRLDPDDARAAVWDRVAFLTRYGGCTLTEALVEIDTATAMDYGAAIGRLIKQENAKRD